MKKIFVLLFSFILLIPTSVTAEIILYCKSDLSTGIGKLNGAWVTSEFNSERWTIKFNDSYSKLYGLEKENRFPYLCSAPYKQAPHLLACLSSYKNGQSFMFNKIKNRFVYSMSSVTGYVNDVPEDIDTNATHAGICSKF